MSFADLTGVSNIMHSVKNFYEQEQSGVKGYR